MPILRIIHIPNNGFNKDTNWRIQSLLSFCFILGKEILNDDFKKNHGVSFAGLCINGCQVGDLKVFALPTPWLYNGVNEQSFSNTMKQAVWQSSWDAMVKKRLRAPASQIPWIQIPSVFPTKLPTNTHPGGIGDVLHLCHSPARLRCYPRILVWVWISPSCCGHWMSSLSFSLCMCVCICFYHYVFQKQNFKKVKLVYIFLGNWHVLWSLKWLEEGDRQ